MRAAREYVAESKPKMINEHAVADVIRPIIQLEEQEVFLAVLLNTKLEIIEIVTVAKGTIDSCSVHPRDVFREAVRQNAATIVLAHNHPSGDTTASRQDVSMTKDLIAAGELLGIKIMDHVIIGQAPCVGAPDTLSMRTTGAVSFVGG